MSEFVKHVSMTKALMFFSFYFILFLVVPVVTHSLFSTIAIFNGLNFSEWKKQIEFYFEAMDLDLALRDEK